MTSAKVKQSRATACRRGKPKGRPSWVLPEGKCRPCNTAGDSLLAGLPIEVDTATDKAIATGGGKLAGSKSAATAKAPGGDQFDGRRTNGKPGTLLARGRERACEAPTRMERRTKRPATCVDIELGSRTASQEKKARRRGEGRAGVHVRRAARKLTLSPTAGSDVRLQSLLPGPGGTILPGQHAWPAH